MRGDPAAQDPAPARSIRELYEPARPPAKGESIYRLLSGFGHGKQWAQQQTPLDRVGRSLGLVPSARSAADQGINCHAVLMPLNSRALNRFDAVSWQQIAERVAKWTAPHSPVMADVVASIRASAADRMAGFMSMHDLAVTTTPVPNAGPIDVIWVRPQPVDAPATQDVLIEHWAPTGWDERVVRPAPDALSLFWRFAREKWGITPGPESDRCRRRSSRHE